MFKTTTCVAAVAAVFALYPIASASRPTAKVDRANAAGVRLHIASSSPVRGFSRVLEPTRRPLYFAIEAALTGNHVDATETLPVPSGMDVVLFLQEGYASRLSGLLGKLNADQVVLFENGKFVAQATVTIESGSNRATLRGMTTAQAVHTTGMFGGARNGAPVTLRPTAVAIQPGDDLTIDVFVGGIPALRAYQVSLGVSGGASGKLEIVDLSVDTTRSDNVFIGKHALSAVDKKRKRTGAVLMTGSASSKKQTYVATFKLKASANAAGTFRVAVLTTHGTTTFTDVNSQSIPLKLRPITISVGSQAGLRTP